MGRATSEGQFPRSRCRNSQLPGNLLGFQIPLHLRTVWISISIQMEVLGALSFKSKQWVLKLYAVERTDVIDYNSNENDNDNDNDNNNNSSNNKLYLYCVFSAISELNKDTQGRWGFCGKFLWGLFLTRRLAMLRRRVKKSPLKNCHKTPHRPCV